MSDMPKGEIKTKSTFFGNPVKDATGEPIKEIKTPEGETYEVKTKSTFFGNPVKDATGEPIKEITKK